MLNQILKKKINFKKPRFKKSKKPYNITTIYNKNQPKKITILKNKNPTYKHVILLNRKTTQQYEQILHDLNKIFKFTVKKLYTTKKKKINHKFKSNTFISITFINLSKSIINT